MAPRLPSPVILEAGPEPRFDAGDLFGVRAIQPEILAREAKAERAACTKPLVVTLGPSADVQLQASRTLEAIAQQPGSEAVDKTS
jgi:hypothetical protein